MYLMLICNFIQFLQQREGKHGREEHRRWRGTWGRDRMIGMEASIKVEELKKERSDRSSLKHEKRLGKERLIGRRAARRNKGKDP